MEFNPTMNVYPNDDANANGRDVTLSDYDFARRPGDGQRAWVGALVMFGSTVIVIGAAWWLARIIRGG